MMLKDLELCVIVLRSFWSFLHDHIPAMGSELYLYMYHDEARTRERVVSLRQPTPFPFVEVLGIAVNGVGQAPIQHKWRTRSLPEHPLESL